MLIIALGLGWLTADGSERGPAIRLALLVAVPITFFVSFVLIYKLPDNPRFAQLITTRRLALLAAWVVICSIFVFWFRHTQIVQNAPLPLVVLFVLGPVGLILTLWRRHTE